MPPGSAMPFQSRSDIHSVAEDVSAIDDDVALVNTNSEFNSPLSGVFPLCAGSSLAGFPWRTERRLGRS